MEEVDPRLVKLSLEPPYRDDNGRPIPNLRDIAQDGTLIFEEKQSASAALAPQLKRLHDLISSRKREFRSVTEARILADGAGVVDAASSPGLARTTGVEPDFALDEDGNVDAQMQDTEDPEVQAATLNPESLMQLRMDMIQRLEEARHSMNTASDLLSCLLSINTLSSNPSNTSGPNPTAGLAGLSSTSSQAPPPPLTLAPSILAHPATKPSVAVMNSQIGITTRDAGIRKAAGILRRAALTAAEEIERAGRGGGAGPSPGRSDTSYWATALRLRHACWALLPAPLPPGSGPALKGSSRNSKDILLGFALEGSSPAYRRIAFGTIPVSNSVKSQTIDDKPPPLLLFPQSQNRRLRVSLRIDGRKYSCPIESSVETPSQLPGTRGGSATHTLNNLMREAQQEIVEQELFQELMTQARYVGTLVSQLSATVIELDVTQDIALLFERVSTEEEDLNEEPSITNPSEPDVIVCTLIRQVLIILLTRAHRGALLDGMSNTSAIPGLNANAALRKQVPILGPVISLLRYRAMVQRVDFELKRVLAGLGHAGVQAKLTMTGASEPGQVFVENLSRFVDTLGDGSPQSSVHHRLDHSLALSGEALLRIEDKHLIQVTFQSPTLLKLHVVQSQITVHDHGQLGDFLRTDVAARVVQYVQGVGKNILNELVNSEAKGSEYAKTWFVDPIAGYCIGRWPGGKGRFQVSIQNDGRLHCEATADVQGKPTALRFDDATPGVQLKDWVRLVISHSLKSTL